jgi:hypothetical protein
MAKYSNVNDEAVNIIRTQNHAYNIAVRGLKPRTIHKLYEDGEDITWRARQYGKDLGGGLQSDENGNLNFEIYAQIDYPRQFNFELPSVPTLSYETYQLNRGSFQNRFAQNYIIYEIKSSDESSYATYRKRINYITTPGPTISILYSIE